MPGTIVASSPTDVVVAGDDGIERKIPLTQVKSVEYGESAKAAPATPARSASHAVCQGRKGNPAASSAASTFASQSGATAYADADAPAEHRASGACAAASSAAGHRKDLRAARRERDFRAHE